MRVLLSWLNELAPVGTDADAVADVLNDLGLAVDDQQAVGQAVDGVVVARVLTLRPHPQADRIQLVDVDAGDGQALQVCCGAFNMVEGDLVPLATLGTVMPTGLEIQRRKLRGEWSNGMLCSGRELELTDDASGILILPGDLPLGTPVFDALGVHPDVVYDLDLTRNRPDAWCHLGVARDLAARLGVELTVPGADPPGIDGPVRPVDVTIVDGDRCGRFTVTVLTGVEVGPSAPWMAERLARAGMRPINNVVDVSNYVMLELGQPNHPYDLAQLGDARFRIRRARSNEPITTLDDQVRVLGPDDLLICDGDDRPIGIAGIMGGATSEISPTTTEVALEMAWFEPLGIAHSAARLGLRTEASARFERGVDPWIIDRAVNRFVELLRETSPGVRVSPGAADARGELPANPVVPLRTARVNALLGLDLDDGAVRNLLEPSGFAVGPASEPGVQPVTVPSWRPDCEAEIDLVEEVARHYGYARIAKTVPASAQPGALTPYQRDRRLVQDVLLGLGISEAMPNPLLGPGDLERAGLASDAIALSNPMVAEESLLRTSLRPGLLEAVAYNESHRTSGVALFEIGRVYLPPIPATAPLPDEREMLAVALAGAEAPAAVQVWQELVFALGLEGTSIDAAAPAGLHPTRSAALVVEGQALGFVGEVDPEVLERAGLAERVAWLEVDLGALLGRPHGRRPYRAVSRYPSSDVDLAFVLPDDVPAARLTAVLASAHELVVDLRLFDVYRGEGVAAGHRSIAYRLRLQAADRTLTDADVAAARGAAIAAAEAVGGVLRG